MALIEKHPRVFHNTRLYTNKDLELLLRAYGVHKRGKKETLADTLIVAIRANWCMTNCNVFFQS